MKIESDEMIQTPNILKSVQDGPIKIRKDESEEDLNKNHEQYTQSRFFDPEQLSFKPMVYPNIELNRESIAKHMQSNTSFGPAPLGQNASQPSQKFLVQNGNSVQMLLQNEQS